MKKCFMIASVAIAVILPASGATVNWAAAQDNGFGLASGTDLAVGSLIRIGTFTNISTATILANKNDLSFLDQYFVEFANASIGDNVFGTPAHVASADSANAETLGIDGDLIFFWAFDASTLAGASQHGIFSLTNSAAWIFPGETPPNTTTIDITDLTSVDSLSLLSGAAILAGGFGVGTSDATGAPLFNLELVPEPSAYALLVTGLILVGSLRFRRRK